MSWSTILKRRKMHSIYFEEFKKALLDMVKELPEGTPFNLNDIDIQNKFIENLRASGLRNADVSKWIKANLEAWLTSIGNRIVTNSGLADKVISGKRTAHIKKAPFFLH